MWRLVAALVVVGVVGLYILFTFIRLKFFTSVWREKGQVRRRR